MAWGVACFGLRGLGPRVLQGGRMQQSPNPSHPHSSRCVRSPQANRQTAQALKSFVTPSTAAA